MAAARAVAGRQRGEDKEREEAARPPRVGPAEIHLLPAIAGCRWRVGVLAIMIGIKLKGVITLTI
jgi:hypothetical protein